MLVYSVVHPLPPFIIFVCVCVSSSKPGKVNNLNIADSLAESNFIAFRTGCVI